MYLVRIKMKMKFPSPFTITRIDNKENKKSSWYPSQREKAHNAKNNIFFSKKRQWRRNSSSSVWDESEVSLTRGGKVLLILMRGDGSEMTITNNERRDHWNERQSDKMGWDEFDESKREQKEWNYLQAKMRNSRVSSGTQKTSDYQLSIEMDKFHIINRFSLDMTVGKEEWIEEFICLVLYVFCRLLLSNRTIWWKFILFILHLLRHFSHVKSIKRGNGISKRIFLGHISFVRDFSKCSRIMKKNFHLDIGDEELRWVLKTCLTHKIWKTPTKRHIKLTRSFLSSFGSQIIKVSQMS